jgi:putative transposase
MKAVVHPANVHDSKGAMLLFSGIDKLFPTLKVIFGDLAYQGELSKYLFSIGIRLEIVKRLESSSIKLEDDNQLLLFDELKPKQSNIVVDRDKKFVVLPFRWIVERSLSWISKCRRLSKDYEHKTMSSVSFIYLANIRLMLNRISKKIKEY